MGSMFLPHAANTHKRRSMYRAILIVCGLIGGFLVKIAYDRYYNEIYALSYNPTFENTLRFLGRPPVQCASPYHPVYPIDKPLEHSPTDCHKIDSADPKFDLEICAKASACNAFTVKILRKDKGFCREMEKRNNMTDDPETLKFIKDEVGPDSFLIRTSGSQRHSSELHRYDGNCDYHFDVSLSNGGSVWLELWHNFERYDHFDEIDTRWWAPMLKTPMLREPLQLSLCSPSCPSYYSPRLNGTGQEAYFSTNTQQESLIFDNHDLPACGGPEQIKGVFLPWHPMDHANPPAPVIKPRRDQAAPVMGHYNFVPTECSLWHDGNQFVDDHSKCTDKNMQVAFFGDSHQRFILHSWEYRLHGKKDFYPEKQKEVYSRSNVTYGESTYHFMWAPWAWDFKAPTPQEYGILDALVVSHSAWATMEGWPWKKMYEHLEDTLDYIEASNPGLKKKVFMTPAPFPPMDAPPRKERRTNVWLGYWNRKLKEALEPRGWMIVDQYEMGMPVMLEMLSADALHLSPSDVHATLVDEILAKTGMC